MLVLTDLTKRRKAHWLKENQSRIKINGPGAEDIGVTLTLAAKHYRCDANIC